MDTLLEDLKAFLSTCLYIFIAAKNVLHRSYKEK